jgi:predicted nucleic acid-binding protein
MSLVLDASVTIAGIYPDEGTPAIHAVMDRVASEGAVVPSLWRLEVANILTLGVRRGRYTRNFRDAALANLDATLIEIDPATDLHAWHSTVELADLHNLTLYDAAYLELALRRGLPLASLDRDLRAAALAQGLTLLGD